MSASALLMSSQGRLRSGWRAALFLLLVVALSPLATLLLALPARIAGRPLPGDATMTVWLGGVVGALAAHWVMLRFVDRAPWSYVGLSRAQGSAARVTPGLALGALAVGIPCAILLAAGWLQLQAASGSWGAAESARLVVMLLVAALTEELLMRGYLLSALADGVGRWTALAVTSVVFALLHLNNPGMSPGALVVVGLAGIFLGAVRFATSSLYAAWAAHFAWNAVLALVLHALVSGSSLAGAGWRTVDAGPDWATGGAWGPEGGVPAALGLVAATSLLIIRRRRVAGANIVTAEPHA
ncbi:MAG: CPBP family intramembrane metalloprotease [Gemmatimonadaceae bacterium]|nr:CPBP family intramembrane metalloprotease [Gemmatimonadaceae bacterium]NUQ94783.1 CPBP family intramembrane metalloprotease [Gemmatimonadaceae bacterium]